QAAEACISSTETACHVTVSQIRTVPLASALASHAPPGPNAQAPTLAGWPPSTCAASPAHTSQTRTPTGTAAPRPPEPTPDPSGREPRPIRAGRTRPSRRGMHLQHGNGLPRRGIPDTDGATGVSTGQPCPARAELAGPHGRRVAGEDLRRPACVEVPDP